MKHAFPAILALVTAGCLDSTQDYVLNPDGSGKVAVKMVFSKIEIGPEKPAAEEKASGCPAFGAPHRVGKVAAAELVEASGLVASRAHDRKHEAETQPRCRVGRVYEQCWRGWWWWWWWKYGPRRREAN